MKFSKTFLIFTSLVMSLSFFLGSFDNALAATAVKKPTSAKTTVAKKAPVKKVAPKKTVAKKPAPKKKVVAKKKSSVNLNPPRITLETAPHSPKPVAKKKTTTKKPVVKKKT